MVFVTMEFLLIVIVPFLLGVGTLAFGWWLVSREHRCGIGIAFLLAGTFLIVVSSLILVGFPAFATEYRLHPGDTASVWTPAPSLSPATSVTPAPSQIATAEEIPTPAPTQGASCPLPVPALVNAHSPVAYGADPNGINESHTGFQNALNAGDLDVPTGTFLINSTVNWPSGRKMKCAAGTLIRTTVNAAFTMFRLNDVNAGGVYGCHFANTVNYNRHPPVFGNYNQQIFFHQPTGPGHSTGHFTWANNDFNGIAGYTAAILIYASKDAQPPPDGDRIRCNRAENASHYFVQLTSATNTLIQDNVTTDANCCVESDNTGQANTGNVIDHHTSTFVYGTGYAQGHMDGWHNYLTGGASCSGLNCNFSGNTVSNSSCGGTAGSWLAKTAQGGSQNNAHYVNNSVSGSCTVH